MFDLIFCRNVLIYFDQDTKTDVLNRLARVTATDGYLVLGAAETVVGLTERFKPVADKRGLYVPNAGMLRRSETTAKPGAAPGCHQRRAVTLRSCSAALRRKIEPP